MVIMYRWFWTSALPLFSAVAAVSSMRPGLEGETHTAVPTRSITSQPMSPVRTCPLVRVTTVKLDAALVPLPAETPSWAFRAAIFWSTRSMMESMNVSFR